MIVSTRPLIDCCPVLPAAMEGRQLCQWDKDSCADAGFLKIDLLGPGDAVLRRARGGADLADARGVRRPLADPVRRRRHVLGIQAADTMGVFQIESRAQMQSLHRTRPESLDDLTIQVAIVRPGPILGGAVNPYIERRQRMREDPDFVVPYDHPSLEPVLRDTLGTIIFQDQVIEVAMAFAGFSPGEAEGLRRAMSRKRSEAAIEAYHQRFIEGAARTHGVDAETAERVYDDDRRLLGLRLPEGARGGVRAAGVPVDLAARPLRAGVPVRAAQRAADGVLRAGHARPRGAAQGDRADRARREPVGGGVHGRRRRAGSGSASTTCSAPAAPRSPRWSPRARRAGPFRSLSDLASRAGAGRAILDRLAWAGACDALAAAEAPGASARARRTALWRLGVAAPGTPLNEGTQLALPLELPGAPALDPLAAWDAMVADYATTGLTIGSTRSRCCGPSSGPGGLHARPGDAAARHAGDDRRAGGRAPAAGDREGDRVPAARGRVRDDQPDRPARPSTSATGWRCGPSRCCSPGASWRSCRWRAGRSTSTCAGCGRCPRRPRVGAEIVRAAGARGAGRRPGRRGGRGGRRPTARWPTSAASRRRSRASRRGGAR